MSTHLLRFVSAGFVGVAALALPLFVPDFLLFEISIAIAYGIAILGLNLLLGFTGQICLAQGALFGVGAYTTAILNVNFGWDPVVTLPVSAITAGSVGVLIGLPALRLQGLQLAIITFGVAAAFPQLLLKMDSLTGGVTGLATDQPLAPEWFPGSQEAWLYGLSLICAVASILVISRLMRGDTGRLMRALRDNPVIAETLGVNLTKGRLAAFGVSSALAGLGGGLFCILNGFISPQSFLPMKSIDILIGGIVGGITSIPGALIGAVFIVFVPGVTTDISPALGGLIYGLCLMGMMMVARQGIAGLRLEKLTAAIPGVFKFKGLSRMPGALPGQLGGE
ncbi:branched-chain amino acid ABC transporter, permease protein (plasmid) [Sinorhizobium fredii NGR234]|uniref:Branched-chain amino acid ABC transporter, permease protein n=1 Tax=Sinorhizobium fredii (strain NBRC 101917 / NGR234) TaxID=394 RepID=C3KKI6_SINFN|nr:branched-chain amino acid ABC transporter permease [Sinorhizobium fredii]ACP22922.1 branched-chain amino acid ABC transporter, permease protein [Sinorhizobium fredii NGR234]